MITEMKAASVTWGAAAVTALAPVAAPDTAGWIWPTIFASALTAFGALFWRLYAGIEKRIDKAEKVALSNADAMSALGKDNATAVTQITSMLARLDERSALMQRQIDVLTERPAPRTRRS
jgi:hypothetical protein